MNWGRYRLGLRDGLLALLTVAVLGLLIWGLLYLNSPRTRARIKSNLEARLSRVIKREFRLGEVGFRLPLSLAIDGMAIASRDSLAGGRLVSVRKIRVAIDPFRSLWQRRLIIARIRVEGLEAQLEQDTAGRWNFEDLIAADSSRTKKGQGPKNFPPLYLPDISLSEASVEVIQPRARERVDSLRLSASLRMGGEHLELRIKDFGLGQIKRGLRLSECRGRLVISGDSLRLKDFEARLGESRFRLSLWLESAAKTFEVERCGIDLNLGDLDRWLAARSGSYRGRMEIEAKAHGSFDDPQGQLKLSGGPLVVDQVRLERIEALAELKGALAKLSKLYIAAGPGEISAQAEMDYRKRIYAAQLDINKLDLERMMAASGGRFKTDINGRVGLKGQGLEPGKIRAQASLFLSRSSLADIPLDTLDFVASVVGQAVEIKNFHLRSGQAAMDIRGDIYPRAISLELETDEIELSQFGPLVGLKDLSGKLRFNGLISGETSNPDVIATFRLKEAAAAGLSCEILDGSLSMKSLRASPIGDGKFSAAGITVAGQNIERAALLAELRGLDWGGFSLVVAKDSLTEANLVGRVEIKPQNLTLVLSKIFYAQGPQMIANSHPVKVVMAGPKITLEPARFILGRGRLELSGQYGPDQNFSADVSLSNIDSRRLVELLNLNKTVHGYLDLDLKAQGTLSEPTFDLRLALNTLRFEQFTADRLDLRLGYHGGRLDLSQLYIQRFGQISEINAAVPLNLGLGKNIAQLPPGPIEGQVILRDIGTWAFFPMADLLSVWEGRVDVNVKLFGTTAQPLFSGEATVNNGKMVLRPLGMYLHSVQAQAHFNADSIVIDNVSALTENNGTVQVKRGEILLEKFLPTTMNIVVATERSPIRNIPFIEANVNSNINIGGTVNNPKISGEVVVNSALITMPFAPTEEPPPPEGEVKPLDMSLNITGNQGIWLRNKDADIELAIENLNVRLQQNLLFLSGRLNTIQGVYRFLDRSFDLTSGELTFTNAVLIDPQLNLTAQTSVVRAEGEESKQYLITLRVTGTAMKIKLAFSSEPPLPEGDILSLLGAGMRTDELSNIDLGSQASRGLDYALSIATGQVQRHTGLDMLKVKTLTGAEKGAQVTIGKYVAKRVYVSYTQGFSANLSNEFKAEYLFGPRSALFAQKDEKGNYNLGVRMRFKY